MANSSDVLWFKTTYGDRIAQALPGTPFDVDMLTAIACQETGELWGTMRRVPGLTPDRIAALCCGDTLDADSGRRAFPRTRAHLEAEPTGPQMFAIARAALLAMAEHVPGYRFARNRPDKFCHGFGMFQYDLQFFKTNPDYFLQRRYEDFDQALARALGELQNGLRKLGLQGRTQISDLEFCHVAICYNTGGFKPARGLKQGHAVNGRFYGEFIRDHLALARRTVVPGAAPGPAPQVVAASRPMYLVDTTASNLLLRREALVSTPREANVIAGLPDGSLVRAITGTPVNGFLEVEAVLGGTVFRGFASAQFLIRQPDPGRNEAPMAAPATVLRTEAPGVPAARLPSSPDRPVRRTEIAGARSLMEPDMPTRSAETPEGQRGDLARIIGWLNVENPAHARYAPRAGLTFCNIYAHDYCTRAGVYLPRVWWNGPALMRMAAGQTVEAKIGNTVDEVRANDLFRWLRDFGPGFGWHRAVTLTDLQEAANAGGVGLIVARRVQDGRSGHIVPVVPETADHTARRSSAGAVTMPLQSQAGVRNFNYGRSTLNWWMDPKFAEFAFWTHA